MKLYYTSPRLLRCVAARGTFRRSVINRVIKHHFPMEDLRFPAARCFRMSIRFALARRVPPPLILSPPPLILLHFYRAQ